MLVLVVENPLLQYFNASLLLEPENYFGNRESFFADIHVAPKFSLDLDSRRYLPRIRFEVNQKRRGVISGVMLPDLLDDLLNQQLIIRLNH